METHNVRWLSFSNVILNFGSVEILRDKEPIAIEPQTFDLIAYLALNPGRVISKSEITASVWSGRFISDSTISSQISVARSALGDDGKRQRVIKTVHGRGYRFELEVKSDDPKTNLAPSDHVDKSALDIRYCETKDGINLAYASLGSGFPLVRAASFLTHLQHDFESVLAGHWVRDLSREFQYIRYDERGNGLSDWEVEDLSFETMITDLETVVRELGLTKFSLLGSSQGASVSIAYAHRHPDKVSCLILYDGYASGFKHSTDQNYKEIRDSMLELTRASWGSSNPIIHSANTALFLPDANSEQRQDFSKLQRITTTPDNAYSILKTFANIDVRHLLADIKVPVLVLHRRDDAAVPFEAGRFLASSIPNARFFPLDGANHIVLEDEPEWPVVLEEITNFIHKHAD